MVPGTSGVLSLKEVAVGNEVQSDVNLQHHIGFVGAMQKFMFNGKNYFEMSNVEEAVENVEITARYDILHVKFLGCFNENDEKYYYSPALKKWGLYWIHPVLP